MGSYQTFATFSNLVSINFHYLIGFEKELSSFTFNEHNEVQRGSGPGPTFFEKYGLFDQLTINDYMPGQGIPPHVDTHSPFEEIFASLSLKSGVTMTLKNPDG